MGDLLLVLFDGFPLNSTTRHEGVGKKYIGVSTVLTIGYLLLRENPPHNQLSFSHASTIDIYTLASLKDLRKIDLAESLRQNAHKPHHAS